MDKSADIVQSATPARTGAAPYVRVLLSRKAIDILASQGLSSKYLCRPAKDRGRDHVYLFERDEIEHLLEHCVQLYAEARGAEKIAVSAMRRALESYLKFADRKRMVPDSSQIEMLQVSARLLCEHQGAGTVQNVGEHLSTAYGVVRIEREYGIQKTEGLGGMIEIRWGYVVQLDDGQSCFVLPHQLLDQSRRQTHLRLVHSADAGDRHE